MSTYDPNMTMFDARRQYFIAANFGEEGNYQDKWVRVDVGPIPFVFPNTDSRRYAARFHDLHHLLTGYPTTMRGELKISGWEIGAGCGDATFAWLINLNGLAAGMLAMPIDTAQAFFRGRHSRSLYREDFDALLRSTVGELRARTGVDDPPAKPTAADWAALIAYTTLAMVMSFAPFVLPVWLLLWWF